MTQTYISQHEDIDFEIQILHSNGVIPLNMSTANVAFIFIHDGYRNIVQKYKTGATVAGWEVIDHTNWATGQLKFRLLSSVTKALKPGKYYIEWAVRFPSLQHPADNNFDIIENGKQEENEYLFSIKKSMTATIVSLPTS